MNNMNKPMTGVFVAATLFCFAYPVIPAQCQDLTCQGEASRTAAVCRTRPLGEAKAEIVCLLAGQSAPSRTYVCAYQIRGWGATSSPYAHTSRVWTCEGGTAPVYLFEQDYHVDASRCDILCGRCHSGWRPAGEITGP